MELTCERCGAALADPFHGCATCGAASRPGDATLAVPGGAAGARREGSFASAHAGAGAATTAKAGAATAQAGVATALVDELAEDVLVRPIPLKDGFRVIGGVRLIRRLGAGGMGAVYAGHHPVLDLPVAVKILSGRLDGSSEERFLREAKLSARIDHPNIVRTRDAGVEHGLFYIQMELIDGISAGELVRRRGILSEVEALAIVLDATRGLAEAHRRGIIHRDVKPDNILVLRDAIGRKEALASGAVRAKLADLGLARAAREQDAGITGAGTTLGTPAYMAPEQIEDASHVGPPADIYSMGATLFELLCGRQPFSAPTIPSLFREILALPAPDPATLRPGLSEPVRAIVRRTLEKPPARRYASSDELLKALEQALATAGRDTPPVVPPPPGAAALAPAARTTVQDSNAPIFPTPVASTAPLPPPRRHVRSKTAALSVLATLAAVAATWLGVTRYTGRSSLLVGMLPDQRLTTERLKETEPVVTFLEKVAHRKVELIVSASYEETVDAFVEGRVDVARLGGVSYVLAKERLPSAIPLVQRESDRSFHALFLGSAASGVTKLEDVKHKRFGFVDKLSTSGYVVPASMLLDAGIDPSRDVIPEFSHAHDATLDSLAKGELDAGVVDELVHDKLIYQRRVKRTQVNILATSPPFPDDVWVARDTVDPAIRQALVKAFVALDPAHGQDHVTLSALEAEATHFVPARDSDYDAIRAMIQKLRDRKLFDY